MFYEPEYWLPITPDIIPGIKPYYMISTYGRIYSNYTQIFKRVKLNKGYPSVSLAVEREYGFKFRIGVARLVKMVFTPILNMNLYEVNHIDGDILNGNILNLEWCTKEYNLLHRDMMQQYYSFNYPEYQFIDLIY